MESCPKKEIAMDEAKKRMFFLGEGEAKSSGQNKDDKIIEL